MFFPVISETKCYTHVKKNYFCVFYSSYPYVGIGLIITDQRQFFPYSRSWRSRGWTGV